VRGRYLFDAGLTFYNRIVLCELCVAAWRLELPGRPVRTLSPADVHCVIDDDHGLFEPL
jgi:hypothetical protein